MFLKELSKTIMKITYTRFLIFYRKEGGRLNLEPDAVGGWFDPRVGHGSTAHLGYPHTGKAQNKNLVLYNWQCYLRPLGAI